MGHIFNLHLPNTATPHNFDKDPKSVFIAMRKQQAGEVVIQHFVSLESLSPDLRLQVRAEILTPSNTPSKQSSTFVGEGARVEPKTVLHEDLDSFVNALADCRADTGMLLMCDDPRSRRIGFIHHPDEGDSVVHEISLRAFKGSTVFVGTAARIGLEPHEVRNLLATYDGRHTLVTGTAPDPTPEQDDLLKAVLMSAPLRVNVQPDGDVEFPDVTLFRGADLFEPEPRTFRERRTRPAWMPDGWAVLKLPEDGDRAGVLDDPSPVGATGAFARRGDRLFRAFNDGRWDESKWHPPVDVDGGRYRPAGYRVHRQGDVGKADIQAALASVLPAYHATAPAVVRGGAP